MRFLRTLRVRLGVFYALVLVLALSLSSAGAYLLLVRSEQAESEPESEKERELLETRANLLTGLGVALPLTLLVGLYGGFLIARRALRSLEEVTARAERAGTAQLGERLPSYTGAGAEIERLAAALNGMLARIEHAVAGLSRFTSDAAHELRTPLATLMSRLEIRLRHPRSTEDLRATIEVSLEELARLSRLVDTLLTLSRCDAGALLPACAETDLGELVAEVCAGYEALASERGLTLTLTPPASAARALAAPLLLRQALSNLLDNACKFTPPAGAIRVEIAPVGAEVQVRVHDSGPGFTAEEAQRAFERFYRSERMRAATEGFGIGLPLARELVRAQGGELTLRPAETGALLVVSLPRPPES